MGKLVDEGETHVLETYLGNQDLYLGLYKDDPEPAETDALVDLTEPTYTGYARKILIKTSWTVVGDTGSQPQQIFEVTSITGSEDVYGYFIGTSLDNSGKLIFVEHFSDGPYTLENAGDLIPMTPEVKAS